MKAFLSNLILSFFLVIIHIPPLSGQGPELILPIGHSDNVRDASFSPDGEKILTASNDRTVKLWNTESGRLLFTLDGFTDYTSVRTLAYSPDGNSFLTISDDGSMRIWDPNNGKLIQNIPGLHERIINVRYSPDSRYLLLVPEDAGQDSVINIWDTKNSKLIRIPQLSPTEMEFVSNAGSKKTLLFSSGNGTANLWEIQSGNLIRSFEEGPRGSEISPDGKYIISNFPSSVKIWDVESGNIRCTIDDYSDLVPSFSPDRNEILLVNNLEYRKGEWKHDLSNSINDDYKPRQFAELYDVLTGKLIRTFFNPNMKLDVPDIKEEHISKLVFSPDNNTILTLATINENDTTICRAFNANNGKFIFSIHFPQARFTQVSYSLDSKLIYIVTQNIGRLYNARDGKLIHNYDAPNVRMYNMNSFSFSTGLTRNSKYLYTVSPNNNSVKIWETQKGDLRQNLKGHTMPISEAVFDSENNNMLAKSWNNSYTAKIWDLLNGKILVSAEGAEWGSAGSFDKGRKILTSFQSRPRESIIKLWNANTGQLDDSLILQADSLARCIVSPDNNKILVIDSNYNARIIPVKNAAGLHKLSGSVGDAKFSPDGKLIATSSWFDFVDIRDAESGRLIHRLRDPQLAVNGDSLIFEISGIDSVQKFIITPQMPFISLPFASKAMATSSLKRVDFSLDGRTLICRGDRTTVWDVQRGSLINTINGSRAAISPDGSRILTFDFNANEMFSRVWDVRTGRLIYNLEADDPMQSTIANFSPDGKNIITIKHDSIKIWDAQNGKLKVTVHFSGVFSDIDWKSKRILINNNSQLEFYDLTSGKELYSFIAIDSTDYLVLTPDKYYMCSKHAASKLSWRVGSHLYSFDQFDLQYNRPDIVLKQLGNPDTSLIKLYKGAYEKRLRKSGFNEEMFTSEWHTPDIKILNIDSINTRVEESLMQLKICGTDSKYKLDRLNVWINDVPLAGMNGMSLRAQNTDSAFKNMSIHLSSGTNKIQVSCINGKGVESFKESVDIIYEPKVKVKPDLYIITLGASEYKDERWDLTYASKDANDFAGLFENQKMNYNKIHVFKFLNKQVDPDSIRKIKPLLLKTNIEDVVMIFYAGHGMLDENLNYFLGSYQIDFNNPIEKGLKYEDLGMLLDSIPARKKIMLVDACHSGEVDKDEELLVSDTKKTSENIVFRSAGVQGFKIKSNLSYKNSFELMKELFADLRKGTGAIVISSAGGGEYAYEGEQWKNGVFTYALIEGLRDLKADAKGNKEISISELRDYVTKRVQQLTQGKQNPSSRSENLEYDFRIW